MLEWKGGFLIPVYNHGKSAYAITQTLLTYALPIILVDDASDKETGAYLAKASALSPLVTLVTKERNSGKGGAVMTGFCTAKALKLTHVLQLDADGQHDITAVPAFLEASKNAPDEAICGYPVFDESAPGSRAKGRGVANFFAHLVTLSDTIRDSMCGFRVYPVAPAYALTHKGIWDKRMGFDIEILVRLYWKRVKLEFLPVHVFYPEGGTSHFHMVRDNARISLVFTRLCIAAPFHLPSILAMQKRNKG